MIDSLACEKAIEHIRNIMPIMILNPSENSEAPSPAKPIKPTQQEIFGSVDDAAAAAFALLLSDGHAPQSIEDRKHWLWVQDRESLRLNGRPFVHGLPLPLQSGLIHIATRTAEDTLFALEEGVRCEDFGFVLGELAGDPRALDFTASRRLSVASERHDTPLFLIRQNSTANLSAARRRWRVQAAASDTNPWNSRAPGTARWHAELFRARDLPPCSYYVDEAHVWQREASATAPHLVDLAAATRA
jgi:protein ImuA